MEELLQELFEKRILQGKTTKASMNETRLKKQVFERQNIKTYQSN